MRAIPPALQAKLDTGVTTLCRCFILTRRDGARQGFTDHDDDIVLNDVICRAGTGLSAREATTRLGLSLDGSEIAGALSDEGLTDADLVAGRYDAASVETYLVDWSEPSFFVLMAKSVIGEVRREGEAFAAELRGLADPLAQESGRLYTVTCSADLSDARCRVNLDDARFRRAGAIANLRGRSSFAVSGLDDVIEDWFTAGRITFTSGANAGLAMEIKRHRPDGGAIVIDLWQAMPELLASGDTFTVSAGCDKRFATCRDRFGNSTNFRGFPHIPGNDFMMRYAVNGEAGNDGSSLQID